MQKGQKGKKRSTLSLKERGGRMTVPFFWRIFPILFPAVAASVRKIDSHMIPLSQKLKIIKQKTKKLKSWLLGNKKGCCFLGAWGLLLAASRYSVGLGADIKKDIYFWDMTTKQLWQTLRHKELIKDARGDLDFSTKYHNKATCRLKHDGKKNINSLIFCFCFNDTQYVIKCNIYLVTHVSRTHKKFQLRISFFVNKWKKP